MLGTLRTYENGQKQESPTTGKRLEVSSRETGGKEIYLNKSLLKRLQVCRCNRDQQLPPSKNSLSHQLHQDPDTAVPPSQLKVGACSGEPHLVILTKVGAMLCFWLNSPGLLHQQIKRVSKKTGHQLPVAFLCCFWAEKGGKINIFESQIAGTKNNTMEFSSEAVFC